MTDMEALLSYHERVDADAFRWLVAKYQGMVFSACVRILGERTAAEDATQEAFLKLASTTSAERPRGRGSTVPTSICAGGSGREAWLVSVGSLGKGVAVAATAVVVVGVGLVTRLSLTEPTQESPSTGVLHTRVPSAQEGAPP